MIKINNQNNQLFLIFLFILLSFFFNEILLNLDKIKIRLDISSTYLKMGYSKLALEELSSLESSMISSSHYSWLCYHLYLSYYYITNDELEKWYIYIYIYCILTLLLNYYFCYIYIFINHHNVIYIILYFNNIAKYYLIKFLVMLKIIN